jgi:hypothetical protein
VDFRLLQLDSSVLIKKVLQGERDEVYAQKERIPLSDIEFPSSLAPKSDWEELARECLLRFVELDCSLPLRQHIRLGWYNRYIRRKRLDTLLHLVSNAQYLDLSIDIAKLLLYRLFAARHGLKQYFLTLRLGRGDVLCLLQHDWTELLCHLLGIRLMTKDFAHLNGCVVSNKKQEHIIVKRNLSTQMRSFTICHEIGHLLLKHQSPSSYGFDPSTMSQQEIALFDNQEEAADLFASQLTDLMRALRRLNELASSCTSPVANDNAMPSHSPA